MHTYMQNLCTVLCTHTELESTQLCHAQKLQVLCRTYEFNLKWIARAQSGWTGLPERSDLLETLHRLAFRARHSVAHVRAIYLIRQQPANIADTLILPNSVNL